MPIRHLKQPVSGKRKMNTRNARIGTGNGHVRLFVRHMNSQPTDAEFDAATCLRQAQHGRRIIADLKGLGYGG